MARRFLEITKETKARLGFYSDLPPNPVEFQVGTWHAKEGDLLYGKPDPDTESLKGPKILRLENSEKGETDIEAQGWEINARLIRILLPEGQSVLVDLRKEPLRLAELEIEEDEKEAEKVVSPSESHSERNLVRITPLAMEAARHLGVNIEEVKAWLPEETPELTHEHVKQFVETKKPSTSKPQADEKVKAAPKTRQVAKELGVDIAQVKPQDQSGIIKLQEVKDFAARAKQTQEAAPPHADFAEFEIIAPTMRRRVTARHMQEAWKAPHASPGIDIDPSALLKLRAEMKESFAKLHETKLRLDHFLIAACAWLLSQKEFRILNAYWHEENDKAEIRLYKHVNIGIASAIPADKTRSGFSELVVPSIKAAEILSFIQIVKEAERLIGDALDGNPKTEDQLGLTFIVNNTGSPVEWRGMKFAGDEFPDPIFAKATSAILAFGAVREENGKKRMRLVLRFDHRICDGYEPKLFLRALQYLLEHPEQILTLR